MAIVIHGPVVHCRLAVDIRAASSSIFSLHSRQGPEMPDQDPRLSSPAALRNRDPIADLLRHVLPQSGTVLELASGSGEHVIHFANLFPNLIWQPSDPSPEARASIEHWVKADAITNVLPPLDIDASSESWPVERADAMIAINMIHISPWPATQGLLKSAGQLLPTGGVLVLYGPYRREGQPLVPSNVEFDASLRARNPAWGIRLLEDVESVAEQSGLTLTSVTDLPANNLGVVFTRQ
jgi:SAM-dependent methyltransferase